MTEQEAFALIKKALDKAFEGKVSKEVKDSNSISFETDLIGEEILDSLDAMVFIMELEGMSGKDIPDELSEEDGFYKVANLIRLLTT